MRVYMTEDDPGQPVALSFRMTVDDAQLVRDVQHLAALWGKPVGESRVGRSDWLRSWRNIDVLASRLFNTLDAEEQCDPETFHHLLMAVGNFKRQAGDIHLRVDFADLAARQRGKSFVIPGGVGRLERDNRASWQRLQQIPGLSIPTASCLLAALWPGSHVIMDVYDRRAAVGLQVGRRSHDNRRLDEVWAPSHEWWFYDWFRRTLTMTAQAADCEPVSVERALYILGARTAKELGDRWEQHGTSSEYYRATLSLVDP
jgi:hypothetical protein